ncbi:Fc.00g076620.m01.CDS01 [Cosmosporella sp. VM-42]
MVGAGYGNEDMLAAARELAASFGGGKGKSRGNSREDFNPSGNSRSAAQSALHPLGNGRSASRASSASNVRQPSYRRPVTPVTPSSSVPPPSQRRYLPCLTSTPFQAGPGSILGSRAMDFLTRQDTSTTPQAASVPVPLQTAGDGNAVVETTTAAVVNVATTVAPVPRANPPLISPDAPTSRTATDGTRQPAPASKPLPNGNASVGSSSPSLPIPPSSGMLTPLAPRTVSAPLPLVEPPVPASGNLADAWFSFMQGSVPNSNGREDADDLYSSTDYPDPLESSVPSARPVAQQTSQYTADLSSVATPQQVSAASHEDAVSTLATNSTLPRVNRQTALGSDGTSNQDRHGSGSNAVNSSSSAPAEAPEGKPDDVNATETRRLRPQAPGFVPRLAPAPVELPETPLGDLIDLTSFDPVETSVVERLPSTEVPIQADPLNEIWPSTPVSGQVHTQTSTTTFVPTGPSSGHIITVTPIDLANGVLVPVLDMTNGQPLQPDTRRPAQRRPTQGLSGSMWAR